MQDRYMEANGIRLHYVEEGEGPLVVLLHGFPDFWYGWRRQIPFIASAGYRVVAPDLRGYNLSSRPSGIEPYRLDILAGDIAALVQGLGAGKAFLVGHDWGGVVAWHTAMHHPSALRGLAILNAPHPVSYRREIGKVSSQVFRSWYAAFFQLPRVPELLLCAGRFALLRRAFRNGPAPDPADLSRYTTAFFSPGALTAALNYYRAALRFPAAPPAAVRIPTMIVWGMLDPYLVPRLAEGLEEWVEDLTVVRVPEAGHWLALTHADRVNRELTCFFARHAPPHD